MHRNPGHIKKLKKIKKRKRKQRKEKREKRINYGHILLTKKRLHEINKPKGKNIHGYGQESLRKIFPKGFPCPLCGRRMRYVRAGLECPNPKCEVLDVHVNHEGYWVKRATTV